QGLLVSYKPSNTLILVDYASNVNRILSMIHEIDVLNFPGKISVFNLQNASAQKTVDKLTKLITQKNSGPKEIPIGKVRFVPDQRTNSILFIANAKESQRIRRLLKQLDRPSPKKLSDIQVVHLENAKAEALAKVLSSLRGEKTKKERQSVISKDVSIVADKPSNSLVIIAEPQEYKKLEPIIKKLDSPRKQVYVEAAILEVSSETTLNLGLQWQGGGEVGSEGIFYGASQGLAGTNVDDITKRLQTSGLSFGILSFPFTYQGNTYYSLGSFLKASQQDNKVHIVSNPQLITMENEEAKVVVAENRPFLTSQQTTETENDYSNYEYKDVGVTLKVTPLINNKGWIKLSIYQELSRVDPTQITGDLTATTPVTRKRTAETTVRVKDGNTVVIAGLIEDKKSNSETKIPILGDIPYVGPLFTTQDNKNKKTNLMVFITPRVIKDTDDSKKITYEKSRLLNKLQFGLDGYLDVIPEGFITYGPLLHLNPNALEGTTKYERRR
ncbi:MAG TPA: type II secretion system secretin GspD, partial [Desulfohalobiaceae bacterium]|nr:type II secretion system secretin GspD [Desulfohalobiaceae bacterium]